MNRLAFCLSLLVASQHLAAKELVLISGFDPFGGASVNNSWNVARQAQRELARLRPSTEVVTCLLPTSYRRAIPALEACLAALPEKPTLVISLGAGPCNVKWETRAHNSDRDHGPDNDGVSRRRRQTIEAGGPAEIGLRLNYGSMWCGLSAEEKRLSWISTDPENFVCNNTAYRFTRRHPEQMFGFIHVPGIACEQRNPGITGRASSPVAKMIHLQLDAVGASTSVIEWPTDFNDARLPTTRNEVRALQRGNAESCEKELLSRWRGAF